MILLPTNLVFHRLVGSFVLSCSTNDAAACAEDPRAQLATLQTHTGATAWGRIRDEWGDKTVLRRRVPLFLWKRRTPLPLPCHSPFPHPHLRTRERTRPCASRTQRVRNSAFPLHLYLQFIYPLCLCVKEKPFLPSPVNRAALIVSYIRVVSK